ncbi:MAG: restriction endonuclease subunit S [Psychrosphaera sp.]|nr:restriction endonuclease subunit S [Psychrosphaera sp.]
MINQLTIENFAIDKSDWIKVKFGDIVFEPKETVKDPIAEGIKHVVGLEHIDSENIYLRRSAGIDKSTTFTKKFSKGDVLFGRRRAYLKKAAQAEYEGICSGDITVMRTKEGLLPALLPFLVNNDKFFDYAITHSAGGLSPRVKFKDLANYKFLLPPKKYQENILELMIATEEQLSINLKKQDRFKTLFSSWLNSTINTKQKWPMLPLVKISQIQTGIAKNKNLGEGIETVTLPYIRVANVQDGYLDLTEMKDITVKKHQVINFSLRNGDLLLTEGGDFDKLGRGFVWQGEIANCLHQNHVFAVRPNQDILNPWFLSLITRSQYGRQYFLRCAKKTSNLASINSSQLKDFRVFVPPIEVQSDIVDKMKAFNKTELAITIHNKSLIAMKRSILNQVF